MNRKLAVGVIGLVAAAFLVWFFALRDRGDAAAKKSGAGGTSAEKGPRHRPGAAAPDDQPRTGSVGAWDVDPAGGLQLEGQVLDADDDPVAGAEVALSSVPQRTATTKEDGGFAFDKLVGRTYAVTARAGDQIGGPVTQQLTATSAPVVIRMRKGATLAVHVVADGDGAPIKGASVELREMLEQTATTDDAGVAKFQGVPSGWTQVVATAAGYAPADGATLVSGSAAAEIKLLMRKGAAVSGTVLDEAGAPVANARVIPQNAGRFWQVGSVEKDAVTTSATGEFAFATVPTGSFRFVAYHESLAPGSSEPVTVDGSHATTGVKIVMKEGGTIRGVVVDKGGAPSANATVQVAPKQSVDWQIWGAMRRVTADEHGAFVVRALPRSQVRLRAESEAAASAVVDVDLAASAERRDVRLVLDVTGSIAGVVVDTKNAPVTEVQVVAMRDLWGGDTENFAMSGFASATTDGGGAFTIRGLIEGQYKVTAHRGGMSMMDGGWEQKGTMAQTGDANVRVVLPTPGTIKGKLVVVGTEPPRLARVSVGWQKSTPAIGGTFVLDDVQPGSYDLTVRGPEFAEYVKRDLDVAEGQTVDVGTLKLERGRRVSGTVADSQGRPVEAARVRIGDMIFTEGGKAGADDPNIDRMMGQRTALTGPDGGFALVGIPKKGGSLVAEHSALGRSDAIKVAPGTGDVTDLKLALRGFGSIAGKVTSKGQPLAAMVTASPKTGGAQMVSVQAGPDGAYVIDKVAEGTHRLSAMQMGMMTMSSSEPVEVVVKVGERTTINIDVPAGDLTVEVAIKPKAGATVNAAQVFLFRGNVAVRNVKELMDTFTAGGGTASNMKFWMGAGTVSFTELVPGKVSICSIPITGDLRDPKMMGRIQKHAELLAVYCLGVELPPTPKQQSYSQELPSMNPIPLDD